MSDDMNQSRSTTTQATMSLADRIAELEAHDTLTEEDLRNRLTAEGYQKAAMSRVLKRRRDVVLR